MIEDDPLCDFSASDGSGGTPLQEKDPILKEFFWCASDGTFWGPDSAGNYVKFSAAGMNRAVKARGYPTKATGEQILSPRDEILHRIETENVVEIATPLAGRKQGFLLDGGNRVLVTRGPKMIEMAAGEWPHLHKYLLTLLGEVQMRYLLAHIKITVSALRSGRPRPGQILIIAGPANCGKSLLASLLAELWGGGVGKPYASLTSKTDFNAELFECVLLLCDDESASSDPRVRKAFGSGLKNLAMNRTQRCHGKGRTGLTLTPLWRVVVLVNDDLPSLQVLPMLEAGLLDKLLIFKASPAALPVDGPTDDDKEKLWSILSGELPGFLHWLDAWTIPEEVGGDTRFGVRSYRNPEIIALMEGTADEVRLLELLDTHLFDSALMTVWEGTASVLEEKLRDACSAMAGRLFFSNSSCGQLLGLLATRNPDRVKKGKLIHGTQKWIVFPPPSASMPSSDDDSTGEVPF